MTEAENNTETNEKKSCICGNSEIMTENAGLDDEVHDLLHQESTVE